jgi:tRNA A37 threonylcarbamoyladenosine biosynthesis protein TsaE
MEKPSIENQQVRMGEIETRLEYIDLDKIKEVLESKKAVKDWAYAVHDKDVKETGDPVAPHVHIMIKLNYPQKIKHIVEWFGVGVNQFEFIGKKNGSSWETAVNYLIHGNDETKYQYAHDEIISNFNYTEFVEKYKQGIKKSKSNRKLREEQIINAIISGEVKRYSLGQEDTEHLITPLECVLFDNSIQKAFNLRSDIISKSEQNRGEKMRVLYVFGESGTGKTTYAKKIARNEGFQSYVSGGSNDPLQDYKGEECLILDDYRADEQKAADIVKMLDNHTASNVKSRYKNKSLAECKLIIITSVYTPEEWWERVHMSHKEPIIQFKRRIEAIYEMSKETIDIYLNFEEDGIFEHVKTIPNKVQDIYKTKLQTRGQKIEQALMSVSV